MEYKKLTFDLYRFQLLPISQNIHDDLYIENLSIDKLKEAKNSIFSEIISRLIKINHRTFDIIQKSIPLGGDWIAFKLGAKKIVEIGTTDLKKSTIDSWPHITIIINNNPDIQTIAISRNPKAFSSTGAVAKLLQRNLEHALKARQLTLHIKPIFDKQDFWSIINKHEHDVSSVKFELISPNMSNISKSLTIDLRSINEQTNSHITNVELNADKGASLELDESNNIVAGLVEYAAQGGGNISVKLSGIRQKIQTNTEIKTLEIDEFTVDNLSQDGLFFLLERFS
jgi:predicted CopG family antitoxin